MIREGDLVRKARDPTESFDTSEGSRVGRLILSSDTGVRSSNGAIMLLCFCDCGGYKYIHKSSLKAGLTRSCGCFREDIKTTFHAKHNATHTPEYNTWSGMKQRCYYEKHDEYENYGGRGIVVCEEWLGENGFITFLKDMGLKPSSSHSIDRIDVNLGYSKDNCKWSTPKEQSNNTRRVLNPYSGISFHKLTGKWQLVIKKEYFGLFATKELAFKRKQEILCRQ